jgi:hypothetical protein
MTTAAATTTNPPLSVVLSIASSGVRLGEGFDVNCVAGVEFDVA